MWYDHLAGLRIRAGSPPPAPAGFGAATRGGAGGAALAVTTLPTAAPAAFAPPPSPPARDPIRFEVAGLITLSAPLVIREPFVTIDGSTAPGGGVCIRGDEVSIRTHDVIVRHLRFRPGDIAGKEVDALNVMDDSHHVLIDHVSTSWAVDENLSASGGIHDVTIQWSIIAEGLNRSVHAKGAHGYGSLVRAVGGVTLHHNLWAHNDSRNPRLGDNDGNGPFPVFDVRNNVIYDFGAIASGMTGDRLSANYVNNYIRPGPSSRGGRGVIVLTDTAQAFFLCGGERDRRARRREKSRAVRSHRARRAPAGDARGPSLPGAASADDRRRCGAEGSPRGRGRDQAASRRRRHAPRARGRAQERTDHRLAERRRRVGGLQMNSGSLIADPQSPILYPQSGILNPQSVIRLPIGDSRSRIVDQGLGIGDSGSEDPAPILAQYQ